MKSESNARILAALRWYTQAASLIVIGIGLMVLVGWTFNLALFKSFLPNLPAIRFNAALSIFLLGVSLWLLRNEETSLARKRIGQVLAGLVLLFNLLTLSEYLFGWDLGIDQLFVHDLNNLPDPYPGRIAPLVILAAGLGSLSLLWLGSRISRVFSYTLATVSFLIILNNLFNFQVPLSQTERIYVPLHAGLAFLMLALGLIMARPTSELMEALISKLPGSRAMRSLLFGIITLTTLFAWLVEGGERAGILDSTKESMLLVILLILAYSPLIYFVARDINQAETKLMLSDQILERVNALVLVADVQGSISYISPSVKTMLGFEPSELLGEGWWKISRPNSAQGSAEKDRLLAVVNQDRPLNPVPYEREIQDRWGNQHWIMWVDALGPDSSIIGVGHDITDRKEMEDALRASERELRALSDALEQRVVDRTSDLYRVNLELERASHAKDEFLAVMSHELRTPLNSILGFSEILLEQVRGPLNDYQEKSLRIVEASGQHLLTLINEILDLSKIEAGKLELHPEPVDVSQLCETGLAFVREHAHQKSISLLFEPMLTGQMISGDPRFLKQILVNLLSNAVKFTPDNGQVTLEVTTDAEKRLLQFSVSDTGIGIAPADLSRLFQPFVQVDSRLNRQFGGTGLGLALVQRLTDLHGGSVHVQTEVGKGSRFTVILPWQPDTGSQPAMAGEIADVSSRVGAIPTSMTSEKRVDRGLILLAEDNPANLLTIGDYLESKDFRVVVAHNGMEAIARAAEISPDIILMDIQMPVMDGLEATRRLRTDPRFGSVPIVALTALAMQGDRERCLEAGATEYLSKPVDLKNLVKMLNSLLGHGE